MGSPLFAVPALTRLARQYPVIGVVTQPDRPAGRGHKLKAPPVKDLALQLGIPVFQPEKLRQPQAFDQLQAWAPDLIVVAAYGQILRPMVLDLPPLGCLNIHASLLPLWRGAAPVQAAILAGDRESGITIMKMDPGVDTGPILIQRLIPLAPGETGGSLSDKLADLGGELLLETLPGYLSGEVVPITQPEEGATYAPMLKKEDGVLDFNQPAFMLERRVRAMNPWPGAFFQWQEEPLKVHIAHVTPKLGRAVLPPGTRVIHEGYPAIHGNDDFMLVLDMVQPAGRKTMTGKEFLSGAPVWEG